VNSRYAIRPVLRQDYATLSERLPALLPGDWSMTALEASPYQQRVLVSRDDMAQVLGFAEYYHVLDECHLLDIAIWPELQSRGLGRHLLEAVLEEARHDGCTQCLLELRRSNVAARALYQRLGFIEVGSRRDYYPPLETGGAREDALLYSLDLR
jgi:ribosomal-protein-alanine N-acetyltransferase